MSEQLAFTEQKEVFVILAVSGGIDSMVMASLFVSSSYKKLAVAHANFGLRGAESDADEALVRSWAQEAGIPFYLRRFDTQSYARTRGYSIEMAARVLRYNWFEELRIELGADYVALAHHANDHAETILLNLTTGTGIRGLCGIPKQRGTIIRPMLDWERVQIEKYAQKMGIPYREDATNALCDFTRNRIRHKVLPELVKINPSVVRQLKENSAYWKEARNILEEVLEQKKASWCCMEDGAFIIDLEKMKGAGHTAYWLFELLHPYGFGSGQMRQIMDVLEAQPGHKVFSPTHILYKDRGVLAVFSRADEEHIPVIKIEYIDRATYVLDKKPDIAALDADMLPHPLTLRRWEPGDRFIPFGMNGSKKVSDFLTDLKLPLWEKERQWVLCHHADIVWVVSKRIDDRYKIGPTTSKVAKISFETVS